MGLQRAQGDYIKPKYLPKDVAIKQYHHLREKEVNAILEYWAKRQDSGKVPFRFRKVAKDVQQNDTNLEENDSDAAARPDEELAGDLQGDNNRHARSNSRCDSSAQQAHSLGNAAENLDRVR